jgi:hypothetical protein
MYTSYLIRMIGYLSIVLERGEGRGERGEERGDKRGGGMGRGERGSERCTF